MPEPEIKQEVRRFYDQVGWQIEGEQGQYQNASYEDLREVSREYIHKCHLRVNRFIAPRGVYLLDAGSGPVQYSEYLTYSAGYRYRVCADISIVALIEARKRLGEKGLYVVADVANLPFKKEAFDGVVSLHTLHHIPASEQVKAYGEIYRVMALHSSAVVVNGWTSSRLMNRLNRLVVWMEKRNHHGQPGSDAPANGTAVSQPEAARPAGTFVHKIDATWLRQTLSPVMDFEIRCWRSVSVRFLRAVIQPKLAGKIWLKLIYALENLFPHWLGENGQYPLVVIRKP